MAGAQRSTPSWLVGALLSCGCYWGFGAGPTLPLGHSRPKVGSNALTEIGLVFDYGRLVRVGYAGSLQLYKGARFGVNGQHVVAPLPGTLQLEVTAYRLPEQVYLRAMARAYFGSGVRVGANGAEVLERDSRSYGGLFGATVLFAGDHAGVGPLGLSVSTGLLVARAQSDAVGPVTFLAPMLLVGFDFLPPAIVYCWLANDACSHHLTRVKN